MLHNYFAKILFYQSFTFSRPGKIDTFIKKNNWSRFVYLNASKKYWLISWEFTGHVSPRATPQKLSSPSEAS